LRRLNGYFILFKGKYQSRLLDCPIRRADLSETLHLPLFAVSISEYGCSMIQARCNDAASQILKHSWWDDDDGLFKQRMKGAKMQGCKDARMQGCKDALEAVIPRASRQNDGRNQIAYSIATEIGLRRMTLKNILEKNSH
jgi:hypothetical protein